MKYHGAHHDAQRERGGDRNGARKEFPGETMKFRRLERV
jgi:hypothetical protein